MNTTTEIIQEAAGRMRALLVIFIAEIALGICTMAIGASGIVNSDDYWGWLTPACLLGFFACCGTMAAMWKHAKDVVLYDAFFYLSLGSSIYFFIGPLIYVFGNHDIVSSLLDQYLVTASDAVWITGLQLAAIGSTGVVYLLFRFESVYKWSFALSQSYQRLPDAHVLAMLLGVALYIKYLIVLPAESRVADVIVVSAPLRIVAQVPIFFLYVMFSRIAQGQRSWLPWGLLLLSSEVVSGLLVFNKQAVVAALLFSGLGWWSERLNWKTGISMAIGLLVLLQVLTPLALYGRAQMWDLPGVASIGDRTEILTMYFEEGRSNQFSESEPSFWERLNYMPVQKAAIDLYDNGFGSDDWERIFWLVVPRDFYPNKPEITSGSDLYEKMTGNRGTSVSTGLFLDGYYNFGLAGVFVASGIVGWVLALYSSIGRGVIRGGGALMYPLASWGIYRGLRVDGAMLRDVFGPLIIFGALLAAYLYVSRLRGLSRL